MPAARHGRAVSAIRLRFNDMPIRLPFNSLLIPVRQNRRAGLGIEARSLFRSPRLPAAEAQRRRLGGAAARQRAARGVRAQGAQGGRLLPPAGGRARRNAADRRLLAARRRAPSSGCKRPANSRAPRWSASRSRCCCGSRDAPRPRPMRRCIAARRRDRGGGVSPRHLQEQAEAAARRSRASISRRRTRRPTSSSRSRPPPATTSRAGSPPCRRTRWTPRATAACCRISRGSCA